MSGQIKRCPVCDSEFLLIRTDKVACSKRCSARLSYRKSRVNYKERRQIKAVQFQIKFSPKPEIYLEVEEFIFQIKRQNFRAGAIDIFKLLDLFDKVYPLIKSPPSCSNIEKSANIMFYKIVNWWRIVGGKAPMQTPDFTTIK